MKSIFFLLLSLFLILSKNVVAFEATVQDVVFMGTPVSNDNLVGRATFALAEKVFTNNYLTICSATLIAPNVLLTAAHCVDDGAAYGIQIVDPKTNKKDIIPVISARAHALYEKRLGHGASPFDIALIKTEKNIPGGVPALLPAPQYILPQNSSVIVAGFGHNDVPYSSARMKMIVANPFLSETEKRSKLEREVHRLLSDLHERPLLSTISRGVVKNSPGDEYLQLQLVGGQPICNGDSGGPSFIADETTGLLVVLGVHSVGTIINCKKIGKIVSKMAPLGFDSYVPFYTTWIHQTMENLLDEKAL